jgi:Flp pilus assembly protein TadB
MKKKTGREKKHPKKGLEKVETPKKEEKKAEEPEKPKEVEAPKEEPQMKKGAKEEKGSLIKQKKAKGHILKKKKPKKTKAESKRRFTAFLEKTGMDITLDFLSNKLFNSSIIINMLLSAYFLYFFSVNEGYSILYVLLIMAVVWTLGFAALLLVLWLLSYVVIDFAIYNRKVGVEDVFPDFLQLTSANIRAGMPIDQALWHAIRPNFGVLAKEMEDVAKKTMSGVDLEIGLTEFAKKYDSRLIQSSVSLLIEGLSAGGEIGELLDRIASNIQESKTMQKEMAASVTTYAIFISFAALGAAPFLLALSNQLLIIIDNIISSIDVPETSSAMAISFSQVGVTPSDFMIFAITTLSITSLLSAAIVATIKKGDIKAGVKYIPTFLVTALVFFLLLNYLLGLAMADIF